MRTSISVCLFLLPTLALALATLDGQQHTNNAPTNHDDHWPDPLEDDAGAQADDAQVSVQKWPAFGGGGYDDYGTILTNYTCPQAYGTFNAWSCSQYIECNQGVARLRTCRFKTLYDGYFGRCVPYLFSRCRQNNNYPIYTSSTQFPVYQFNCPNNQGTFRASRCDQYVVCWNGRSVLRSCPIGKVFDDRTRKCTSSKFARCEDGPYYSTTILPTVSG